MRALYISGAGLSTEETKMDLIANNISNINTNGYKFQEAFTEEMQQVSTDSNNTMSSTPAGTEITSVSRNFKAGNLVSTGNALDLAIQGDGFFQVTLPDESIGYTRAGSLTVDATGSLVTKDGNKVYPDITIPQDAASLSVSANGIISATKADGTVEDLGALELGKFTNPDGLETIGSGVYKTTPASGDPVIDSPGKQGIGTIQQGYTESSNVDMVSEMVKMMMTQKSYEINAKVMQTTDTMMGIANGIKR